MIEATELDRGRARAEVILDLLQHTAAAKRRIPPQPAQLTQMSPQRSVAHALAPNRPSMPRRSAVHSACRSLNKSSPRQVSSYTLRLRPELVSQLERTARAP